MNHTHELDVAEKMEIKKSHFNPTTTIGEDMFIIKDTNVENGTISLETPINEVKTKNIHPLYNNGKLHPEYVHFDKSAYMIKCERAGDSKHLSDQNNLRETLF